MNKGRAWLFGIFAVLVAFGAGFGYQYTQTMEIQTRLDSAMDELELLRLRGEIGQASLLAQAGDYEAARQRASAFFTQLQALSDQTEGDDAGYEPILARRDEVITALSRANPQSVELLSALYARISGAEPPAIRVAEPAGDSAGG